MRRTARVIRRRHRVPAWIDRLSRLRPPPRPGPGGVGDGLPVLPSGEPVLHRWFAIAMVVLVPLGVAVVVWALVVSGAREVLPAAARRPPGTAEVTHERGDAVLNRDRTTEPGPDCAGDVEVIGDPGARAALIRALRATCLLLERPGFDLVRTGLERWAAQRGLLRVAVFELTGVDSSSRLEDGRIVIELNARFQFTDATRAAPAIVHELVHIASGMPGRRVTADAELEALRAQDAACRLLVPRDPPRLCADAAEVLAAADPLRELRAAGYPE